MVRVRIPRNTREGICACSASFPSSDKENRSSLRFIAEVCASFLMKQSFFDLTFPGGASHEMEDEKVSWCNFLIFQTGVPSSQHRGDFPVALVISRITWLSEQYGDKKENLTSLGMREGGSGQRKFAQT